MEPITPKTSENKTSQKGVKFWAVEDNAGTKYTIWDEAIAQIWEANFGNEMEMDVKRSGNFLNIRGITDSGKILKEVQNGVRSLNGQEQPSLLEEANKEITRLKNAAEEKPVFDRNTSIIAQCLVKATLGTYKGNVKISEAVEMYHKALELIG